MDKNRNANANLRAHHFLISTGLTTCRTLNKIDEKTLPDGLPPKPELERSERYSVNDLFQAWLQQSGQIADGNKELTRNYNEYIKPSLGALELRALTKAHIRDLLQPVIAARYCAQGTSDASVHQAIFEVG